MGRIWFAVFGILGLLASAVSAHAGPAIASEWGEMNISQEECFKRGEAAIKQLGFGQLERTRFSRYGQLNEYTVVVRCVAEKKLVLFFAAGPSREQTQKYQIQLFELYDRQ